MISPPNTEAELLDRAAAWAGQTIGHLKNTADPKESSHKGSVGQWFEKVLGADANNTSRPDFTTLNIELKTLPIGHNGTPRESTFVTAISLTQINQETWEKSSVYRKLKRVLWIPIEGDPNTPLLQRRIGQAFLWSPNPEQMTALQSDWQYLANRIVLGQLETISAKEGNYLQIRPKAANGKSLTWGINEQGEKVQTLPRGFYLRAGFTAQLLNCAPSHFEVFQKRASESGRSAKPQDIMASSITYLNQSY